jgi:hypothetical protein
VAVTHPRKAVQVQLLPDALTARSSIGERTPAPQAGRMGSIPIRATDWPSGGTGRHARLRTSCLQGVGVRLSPWSLRSGLESGFQHGLISRSTPVRIRPPQLDGRVRKSAKRPGREPGESLWVRFPPRLLQRSRGPAAKTPGPHPGNDGSSPSGITDWAAGPRGGRRLRTPEMRVRIPRGPLAGGRKAVFRQPWKLETVGSIPTPLTEWAHGPTGRHQFGRLEIRVRFPVGPLWKVAGYGWPGRSAKAVLPTEMRVRLPCLPLLPRW